MIPDKNSFVESATDQQERPSRSAGATDPSIGSSFRPKIHWRGELYPVRIRIERFPQWCAAVLREQTAEWSVLAFARRAVVRTFLIHEGEETAATSFLPSSAVVDFSREKSCDTVILLRGHCESGERQRLRVDGSYASTADYESAYRLARLLEPAGVGLLAMVCAQETAHEFFWRVPGDGPQQLSLESIPGFAASAPRPTDTPRSADGRFIACRSPWAKLGMWSCAPVAP